MRLVNPDGSIDVGADAVYQIARRLSGWKHVAWLYRVPVLKWDLSLRLWLGREASLQAC